MKKIYKYEIAPGVFQALNLPAGAEVLSIQVQHGRPHIWAAIDTEKPLTTRTFCVYGTGVEIPDFYMLSFIGTFQLADGDLVFHLFEKVIA